MNNKNLKELVKKKDGFTMVEILIVILIVGVLSTLAINGYTQYRRSTLLDFSVDGIVSYIYEYRDKTIHGDVGADRFDVIKDALEDDQDKLELQKDDEDKLSSAKCYGLYFKDGDVFKFDAPFKSKVRWDSVTEGWVYESCSVDLDKVDEQLGLDEMIEITEIYLDENMVDELAIVFSPPFGAIEVRSQGIGNISVVVGDVLVVVKYGVSDEDQYKKKLLFNIETGEVSVMPYKNDENI